MSLNLTVMTRKGQITIPAELRRALNLREGDKVAVLMENGHLRVSPYGSVTSQTAGMLAGPGPILSAEELREAAEQAIADDVIERMGT
jgi:AbrB family looped-hinge helix DNA binding protein